MEPGDTLILRGTVKEKDPAKGDWGVAPKVEGEHTIVGSLNKECHHIEPNSDCSALAFHSQSSCGTSSDRNLTPSSTE